MDNSFGIRKQIMKHFLPNLILKLSTICHLNQCCQVLHRDSLVIYVL